MVSIDRFSNMQIASKGVKKGGLNRQVVVMCRWSLEQVLLYFDLEQPALLPPVGGVTNAFQ